MWQQPCCDTRRGRLSPRRRSVFGSRWPPTRSPAVNFGPETTSEEPPAAGDAGCPPPPGCSSAEVLAGAGVGSVRGGRRVMLGEATVVPLPIGAMSAHVLSSHLHLVPISAEAAAATQTGGGREEDSSASPIAHRTSPLLIPRCSTESARKNLQGRRKCVISICPRSSPK